MPHYPIADADMNQTEVVGHDKKVGHMASLNWGELPLSAHRNAKANRLITNIVHRKQLAMAPRSPVDTQFTSGIHIQS